MTWNEIQYFIEVHFNTIQWLLTFLILFMLPIMRSLVRKRLNNLLVKNRYEAHRAVLTRRILNFGLYLASTIALLTIWGANVQNIWIYFSSILGVIAVGFFATWSILSNIIAGLFIYTSNPFKIGSTIKFFDPEIEAAVKDINLLYTQLEDEEGFTQVPNSVFFQQSFKVLKISHNDSKI
ncbi:mechanosensitive ion channel [Fulvivirga kasyanovii]|uniref:Mechanosensitive ion channel family protein n=1 Tax=Fulvivirga kasyanovii TaxID=396812 RepID=A0ABW9RSS8_9BACT|nr:mechanosensitive ion channel domain-containing protein [Fulvivirga kasyanovii]MTI27106.1 mechanosensitive ion channel family protein [Fulvivirga kasyanovii]